MKYKVKINWNNGQEEIFEAVKYDRDGELLIFQRLVDNKLSVVVVNTKNTYFCEIIKAS